MRMIPNYIRHSVCPLTGWLGWLSIGLPCGRSGVRTPTEPTLRVFGLVRRKCCLCNYICKRFDSLVFLDENDKPNAPSCNSWEVNSSAGRQRTHPSFEKSRARSSRFCGWPSSITGARGLLLLECPCENLPKID